MAHRSGAMDHIEIVTRKRPHSVLQTLEPYQTEVFTNVVYTNEDGARAEKVAAEPAPVGPDEPDDDGASSESSEQEAYTVDTFYARFVDRTPEQCLEEMKAPQRSSKWLLARAHVITASSFGAASGNNPYCSPSDLILEKLWRTFVGNEYTQYGTFHEPDARNSFVIQLDGPLQPTLQAMYAAATGMHCKGPVKYDLF